MATIDSGGAAAGGKKPAPKKPKAAAKKSPAKNSPAKKTSTSKKPKAGAAGAATQPPRLDLANYRPGGTFMPEEHDPLDTPAPEVAGSAAAIAKAAESTAPITPDANRDAGMAVMKSPTSSVDEVDARARFAKLFALDTEQANDYGRAAAVVAATSIVALVAVITTSFVVAIFAGIVALALASGLAAVMLGVRGWNSAVRGIATNQWLSLASLLVGTIVVIWTLVVLVGRAVGQ